MEPMDIVILLLFLLQLGGMVAIVVAVLKIKNGSVAAIINHVNPLILHGKMIVERGQVQVTHKKDRFTQLIDEVKGIVHSVKRNAALPDSATMPINYKQIGTAFAVIRTVRSVGKQFSSFRSSRKKNTIGTPPGPAKAQRAKKAVTFAERLGLVPPAAKHVGRAYRVAKYGLEVRKQLKKQGILK